MHREGDQPLLGAVVQIAFEPTLADLTGGDQPKTRGSQSGIERPALAHHGGERQRRQRSHGDVQLGREHTAGNRVEGEGTVEVRRAPDREARHDQNGQRCPSRAEAQRRPDQRRERRYS